MISVMRGGYDDPASFVVSLNLKRRHLDASQRAMVVAKLANISHGGDRSKPPIGGLKTSDAAKMLNVGGRSVERAKAVQRDGVEEPNHATNSTHPSNRSL